MKRVRQHCIDEVAQRILRNMIPPAWVATEHTRDYGKDYEIEVVDDEELTGTAFTVQLKGKEIINTNRAGTAFSFSMSTAHLTYYLEKVRRPVMLIVCDTQRSIAYYLFVQKYLKQNVAPQWKQKATLSLEFPITNLVSDTARFKEAVIDAEKFMQDLYPGSLPAAAQRMAEEFRAIDGRFEPEIEFINGQTNITFRAKETVRFSLTVKGTPAAVQQKVADLVDRGVPVQFTPGELEFHGMPLLAKSSKNGATLHYRRKLPLQVTLSLLGINDELLLTLPEFDGEVSGGNTEGILKAGKAGFPFSFTTDIKSTSRYSTMNGSFDPRIWIGQPFSRLSYFDQFFHFVMMLQVAPKMRMTITRMGHQIASLIMDPKSMIEGAKSLPDYVQLVKRAIDVFNHWKTPIIFPKNFSDHEETINELYMLMSGREFEPKDATYTVSFVHTGKLPTTSPTNPADFKVEASEEYDFWGTKLLVGSVSYRITGPSALEESPVESPTEVGLMRATLREARIRKQLAKA